MKRHDTRATLTADRHSLAEDLRGLVDHLHFLLIVAGLHDVRVVAVRTTTGEAHAWTCETRVATEQRRPRRGRIMCLHGPIMSLNISART